MEKLVFEPYSFDLARRQMFVGHKRISLTSKEYQLALHLFSHRGDIVSRKDLLETVWETSAEIHTRTVDAHVSRLRHKLQLSNAGWEITGIYKRGYCLQSKQADEVAEVEGMSTAGDAVTED